MYEMANTFSSLSSNVANLQNTMFLDPSATTAKQLLNAQQQLGMFQANMISNFTNMFLGSQLGQLDQALGLPSGTSSMLLTSLIYGGTVPGMSMNALLGAMAPGLIGMLAMPLLGGKLGGLLGGQGQKVEYHISGCGYWPLFEDEQESETAGIVINNSIKNINTDSDNFFTDLILVKVFAIENAKAIDLPEGTIEDQWGNPNQSVYDTVPSSIPGGDVSDSSSGNTAEGGTSQSAYENKCPKTLVVETLQETQKYKKYKKEVAEHKIKKIIKSALEMPNSDKTGKLYMEEEKKLLLPMQIRTYDKLDIKPYASLADNQYKKYKDITGLCEGVAAGILRVGLGHTKKEFLPKEIDIGV